MCLAEKMATLAEVGCALNEAGVTWAVGGSLLLYLRSVAPSFRDIDILVAEDGADAARQALCRIGKPRQHPADPRFCSKRFDEFDVRGVEVDLIAGFAVVSGGVAHECPLAAGDIAGSAEVEGVRIPLDSLEKWERRYRLMDRPEKAERIRAFLAGGGA